MAGHTNRGDSEPKNGGAKLEQQVLADCTEKYSGISVGLSFSRSHFSKLIAFLSNLLARGTELIIWWFAGHQDPVPPCCPA